MYPEYAFDRKVFGNKKEISQHIEYNNILAEKVRQVWKQTLMEPLRRVAMVLDQSFAKSSIQLPNYWEYVPSGNRKGDINRWTRAVMLQRVVDGVPYKYEITETLGSDSEVFELAELSRLEIRIKFSDSPPYEWEVHTLSMQPTTSDFIWIPTEIEGEYTSTDEELYFRSPSRLIIDVSRTPSIRLRKLGVDESALEGRIVSYSNIARMIFASGVEQVELAINDPNVYVEAFEPSL